MAGPKATRVREAKQRALGLQKGVSMIILLVLYTSVKQYDMPENHRSRYEGEVPLGLQRISVDASSLTRGGRCNECRGRLLPRTA